MTVYIYHLLDEDERIRYVGQAVDPQARMRGHCKGQSGPHCRRWIRKMRRLGHVPTMMVVREVDTAEADQAEADEIALQVAAGARLTNIRLGPLESPYAPRVMAKLSKELRRRFADEVDREIHRERIAHGRMNPTVKVERPESVERIRALRREISDCILRILPTLNPTEYAKYSPDPEYITTSFVRRHEKELRQWLDGFKALHWRKRRKQKDDKVEHSWGSPRSDVCLIPLHEAGELIATETQN